MLTSSNKKSGKFKFSNFLAVNYLEYPKTLNPETRLRLRPVQLTPFDTAPKLGLSMAFTGLENIENASSMESDGGASAFFSPKTIGGGFLRWINLNLRPMAAISIGWFFHISSIV